MNGKIVLLCQIVGLLVILAPSAGWVLWSVWTVRRKIRADLGVIRQRIRSGQMEWWKFLLLPPFILFMVINEVSSHRRGIRSRLLPRPRRRPLPAVPPSSRVPAAPERQP